ncbi:hypothetical protein [Roseomonas chloroacetimidivorans]|uniref:hypothetical protein n=1 Tax=Roseomonas chloroacetimidivorans TaxID=1766656 RepID=UPI003C71C4D2
MRTDMFDGLPSGDLGAHGRALARAYVLEAMPVDQFRAVVLTVIRNTIHEAVRAGAAPDMLTASMTTFMCGALGEFERIRLAPEFGVPPGRPS